MPDNPNAEIIAIGTELLLGEITDTNSVYMARGLRDCGVNLYYMTTVGDNLGRIADSIRAALGRADVVITCGGLGPTVDDVTRQAVAEAMGRGLEFHQSLYDTIAERFRGFGSPMTENNRQQAYLPRGAILVPNPVGTAPSFVVEGEGGVVISLPGVPREMKYLFGESVVPYLQERYELGVIVARILRTAGIGESALDDKIGSGILNGRNPSVGLAAHHGCVDIRLTAKARSREEAEGLLDGAQEGLYARVGEHIFGVDDSSLEGVVAGMLKRHGLAIHIVEAGLPGVISGCLDAGESVIGVESYEDPDAFYASRGMDSGEMAMGEFAVEAAGRIRGERGAAACVVVMSNPDNVENADTEVGSAVAVSTAGGAAHRVYGFGARSQLAGEWLSRWGLANLWRLLREGYGAG